MTVAAAHQPDFLPYPGFFRKMLLADVFILYDTAQFSPNGYHNRNRVKTPRGWIWITVPVRSPRLRPIRSIAIDNHGDWGRRIWRTLEANYARAEYFDRYAPGLEAILAETTWERLVDLNRRLLDFLRAELGIGTRMVLASDLPPVTSTDSTDRLLELLSSLGADTYVSGPGGAAYQDESKFRTIRLLYEDRPISTYRQLWGPFAPNLSVIDALFNCGPETRELLQSDPVSPHRVATEAGASGSSGPKPEGPSRVT